MRKYSSFKKGSLWRKWDLHIHTPGTNKNDSFNGKNLEEKWENYIFDINNSKEDISVIGITDYFSVKNYFKFKDHFQSGMITKKIDLIIPNVELRIAPVTGKKTPINIHCLFNPAIDKEIESRFLSRLTFKYGGSQFSAIENELIRLGREIINDNNHPEDGAYKLGVNQFVITIDNLQEIFEADLDLRSNTVIVVANSKKDGVNGLSEHEKLILGKGTSQLDSLKERIYQFSDAIFSGTTSDIEFFLGKRKVSPEKIRQKFHSIMPCFHGCDAHTNSKIFNPDGGKFCWIKSDPTFTGLKQVLYEPEERIKIQQSIPEDKEGYQVIEKIYLDDKTIYNGEIQFNANLNSIIGGRSTGKSVLLTAIAQKLRTEKEIKFESKPGYDEFVGSISSQMRIVWQDGQENDDREVEFFKQGYMYELARDSKALSRLIQNILEQKGKRKIIDSYNQSTDEIIRKITSKITAYFQIIRTLKEDSKRISDLGDSKGIKGEIGRLEEAKRKFQGIEITKEEDSIFKVREGQIKTESQKIEQIKNDLPILENLLNQSLFRDELETEFIALSEEREKLVLEEFKNIKNETISLWKKSINKIIQKSKKDKEIHQQSVSKAAKDEIYQKVVNSFNESEQLKEIKRKIEKQEAKYREVHELEEKVLELNNKRKKLKQEIFAEYKNLYLTIEKIIPNLSFSKDGLEIKGEIIFDDEKYQSLLKSAINMKAYAHQDRIHFEYDYHDDDIHQTHIKDIVEALMKSELKTKRGHTPESLIKNLLTQSYYELRYDIIYENDPFTQMSDGKKAFVVLKLLLDFSDKSCPILIDQPEDDLDNRAIFNELVTYLKKKKKERQIIVATHNPNIVVGADSELVIIANQHGTRNTNSLRDNGLPSQFQYVQGSLEFNFPKEKNINEVLFSQGIREHVCEILEGGNTAFTLREKKYSLNQKIRKA